MAKTKYLGSEMNTLKDTADDTEVRGMRVADIRPDEVITGQEAAMMEDIATPGQLDFDLVRQAAEESRVSEDDIGPFHSHLVKSADEEVSAWFQKYIRESRLSSHMMMMGFKS